MKIAYGRSNGNTNIRTGRFAQLRSRNLWMEMPLRGLTRVVCRVLEHSDAKCTQIRPSLETTFRIKCFVLKNQSQVSVIHPRKFNWGSVLAVLSKHWLQICMWFRSFLFIYLFFVWGAPCCFFYPVSLGPFARYARVSIPSPTDPEESTRVTLSIKHHAQEIKGGSWDIRVQNLKTTEVQLGGSDSYLALLKKSPV
jgi:hypothetical protein